MFAITIIQNITVYIINRITLNATEPEPEIELQKIEVEDDQRCAACNSTEAGNCFYCKMD